MRDRIVSVALGRPVLIDKRDTDVEMLTVSDFIEDESPNLHKLPPDQTMENFFIQFLHLSEITSIVIDENFSLSVEKGRQLLATNIPDITRSELALRLWLQDLPTELQYDYSYSQYHFLKGVLFSYYNCLRCLIHRFDLSRHNTVNLQERSGYMMCIPSRKTAFEAAHNISKIAENMRRSGDIAHLPSTMVYALFTAMVIVLYELQESESREATEKAQKVLSVLIGSLKIVSGTWVSGGTLLHMFLSVAKCTCLYNSSDLSVLLQNIETDISSSIKQET